MATLKGQTIAASYQDLVKRADTYAQAGTNIELMDDSGDVQATGLYLESNATTSNVGIGIAAPARNLHINSSGSTEFEISSTGDTSNTFMKFNSDSDGTPRAAILGIDHSDNVFRLNHGASFDGTNNGIAIDSSGNVGIGSDSPDALLDIEGGAKAVSTAPHLRISNTINDNDWDAGDVFGGVEFYTHDTSYSGPIVNAYMRAMHLRAGTSHSSADTGLQFGVSTASNDVTAMAAMSIITGGRIGIGTDVPQDLLHIADADTSQSAHADSKLILEHTGAQFIEFLADAGEASLQGIYWSDGDAAQGSWTYDHANDKLQCRSGGGTRMTIDNAGDVTITGDLIMADGKGINFAAMTSPADAAGMTAEILDDYEEGYITETITCEGSGGYNLNGSLNTLAYTKIGRVVHIQGSIQVESENSPSGILQIDLPFTSASLTENSDILFVPGFQLRNHGDAGLENCVLEIVASASKAAFHNFTDAGTKEGISESRVDTAFDMYFSFSYIAA